MKLSTGLFAVSLITGLILIAGVFIPGEAVREVNNILLDWIITLAGVAGLAGILNLLSVHSRRLKENKPEWAGSLVVLAGFTGMFIAGMLLKPGDGMFNRVAAAIILPVETSLLALLSITLTLAIIRAIRPGMSISSMLFIVSALVFLWAATGFVPFQNSPGIQNVLSFFNTLPLGGARGLLLGIGLGSLTAGIRALIKPTIKGDE